MVEPRAPRPRRSRPTGSHVRIEAAAALGLALAACGEPAESIPAVQHLDPRLADGGSATEVLSRRRRVVAEWTWNDPADRHEDWAILDAKLLPGEGDGGVLVAGTTPEEGRLKRVALRASEPFPATRFNVVELVLGPTKAGTTRVIWQASEAEREESSGLIEVSHGELEGPAVVRAVLDRHPDWRGRVRSFRILPNGAGPQVFELHALRLVAQGFAPGTSPLREELATRASGDGGLLSFGLDMRRAWPTDWGVPLHARAVRVPPGGRVEVAFGFARARLPAADRVHATIDVRPSGGGEWRELARLELGPDELREPRWHPLVADLGAARDPTVDVRFRARSAAGTASELEDASVFVGEPLVVGRATEASRPNVVLVTIDTTRADAVGDGANTPFLDGLARRALVAVDHWSASNATTPSHASLLTGLAVQDHGATNNHSRLAPENVTLAETFRRAGWQTAAAISVDHLRAPRSGLGQGFDRFWLSGPEAPTDGAVTLRAVTDWLARWKAAGERPFFLWVHLFDPHTPYGPPASFLDAWPVEAPPRVVEPPTMGTTLYARDGRFLDGVTNEAFARWLYGASVSYADALVGRLDGALRTHGWIDRTAFVVTSDHGESLGEHDIWYQHAGLYEEVLRVPLYVALPGLAPTRLEALTSALDVPATLWTWAGLEPPDEVRGRDLLALARRPDPRRHVRFEHSHGVQVGSRDARHHFIWTLEDYRQLGERHFRPAGDRELYDHVADPALVEPLADTDALERATEELAAWRASALGRSSLERELTPDERSALEALGYFGE